MESRRPRPAGRFDLIPPGAERRLAELFERDAKTFGQRDWEDGSIPLSGFVNMARDSLNKLHGRDTSDDHAARAVWALLGYMHVEALCRAGRLPEDVADMPAPDPILSSAEVRREVLPAPTVAAAKAIPPKPPASFLLPPAPPAGTDDDGGE